MKSEAWGREPAALAGCPIVLRVSRRARRTSLRFDARKRLFRLTVPRGIGQPWALRWAAEKEAWACDQLAKVPARLALKPGCEIPLFGRPHRLDWREANPRTVRLAAETLITGGPLEHLGPRLLRWLRRLAREHLEAETRELAGKAGLKLISVGIGDATGRWGSCSAKGAIRYSWRLILAPDFVRRGVVAHEVAHLKHLDHGPEFHALTEHLLGEDPAPAIRWLRRHGPGLHAFAAVA